MTANNLTIDEHSKELGGIVSNLQSLEFIIRAYLQKYTVPTPPMTTPYGENFYSSPIGTELPENFITNYDTLGALIDKCNLLLKTRGLKEIDRSLVDIRDALAHGRASALAADDQMRLIKFSKPVNGKVKIVFNEVMSMNWLKSNKRRIYDAIIFLSNHY